MLLSKTRLWTGKTFCGRPDIPGEPETVLPSGNLKWIQIEAPGHIVRGLTTPEGGAGSCTIRIVGQDGIYAVPEQSREGLTLSFFARMDRAEVITSSRMLEGINVAGFVAGLEADGRQMGVPA